MEIDLINRFIKYVGINTGLIICFLKILNYYKLNTIQKVIIILWNIIASAIQSLITYYIDPFFVYIPLSLSYSITLSFLTEIKMEKSFVVSVISLAISYIFSAIPVLIASIIFISFRNIPYMQYTSFIIMSSIHILFIFLLFKLKRLKYGFSFLENDYLRTVVLIITTIILISYVINDHLTNVYLTYIFIIIALICIFIIKQSFIIYHKQKLQNQALKDYEKELAETKQKLQVAIDEKERIVKSNHEFYHRQEALKNKLNIIANSAFNSEIAEEISSITSRINNLSEEYNQKCTTQPKLVSTNIEEIDDMLLYFQNECTKNNIEFSFKLECNINKILDNFISKSQLETLIGDLLRNAIIAVNHSENSFRSIMLVLGLHDDFYEIDVYDSGINFEINTLINLGITKCSTHLDEGGTGIGFITTFETLNNCKASLIITELDSENYTKIIGIRFDNQKQYIINSARASVLKENNLSNRDIIFNNKKEANI